VTGPTGFTGATGPGFTTITNTTAGYVLTATGTTNTAWGNSNLTLSSITATVVGTGGVAPRYASFYQPQGVAVIPSSGVIVVADQNNNRIRFVTPVGVVTTLAGSGTATFADGTGTAASFYQPQGVAVIPSSGVIVVADTNNHRVRLITQAGVVTTLAGSGTATFADGTGAAASFNGPTGVAVLPNGTIVVADQNNHRIRLITPAGVVTTLAGSGAGYADGVGAAASFNSPFGVAVIPSSGVIVVTDTYNNRIRLITPAGVVTTLAGSGAGNADGTGAAASFYRPSGVAVLPNGTIVVTDVFNNRIRLVTQAGVVTTLAGSSNGFADGTGTAASFSSPYGVAVVPSSGVVVVADYGNNRIRLVTYPGGVVTTLAGSAPAFANGFGPTGPALLVAGSSTFAGPVNITNLLGNTGPTPNIPALEVDGDALVAGNMIVTAGAYSMPSTVSGSIYNTSGFTNTLGAITGTYSGPIPAYDATVYSFTAGTGTFVVPTGAPVIVDYLIVGGGGAGGNWIGGGGGAGGLVYAKGIQLPAGSYTWTVGAGGVGVTGCNVIAGNGSNSSLSNTTFGNVVAVGGGAGGTYNSSNTVVAGRDGGSGGGGPQNGTTLNPGGSSAIGQGNSGGSCSATAFSGGGGGGGAGSVGTSTTTTTGGAGGIGLVIPITGSNVYYAGGGAGAADGPAGAGGLGGGGAGIGLSILGAGISGLANTGGGGGGAARNASTYAGGSGGSGVVIVRVYTNTGSRLLIGDGSGYSMALSAQSNAVTTDVMTVTDQGNVSIGLSNALFNGLLDGTFDSSGNMYICDGTNNRVRKISPAGIVTTLIGNGRASNVAGTGTEASIISPSGLVLDTTGNMWVSTLTGHQIAKVVLSTLAVTFPLGTYGTATVAAGTGAASTFASPRGLAYDSVNGFLWVAQVGVISRILISTLTSTLLSSGPTNCLTLAYDGTFLYASTSTTIQKITTPGGVASTATLYTLTYPWGLSLSPSKATLYFSQLNGGPIGSAPVPTAGTVTILAGSNGVNGSTDATGTAASFSANVQGIFLDNLGSNIYITDFILHKIRKLNIATSNVTTYAGTGVAGFADGSVPTATVVNNTLLVSSNIGINCNAPQFALDVTGALNSYSNTVGPFAPITGGSSNGSFAIGIAGGATQYAINALKGDTVIRSTSNSLILTSGNGGNSSLYYGGICVSNSNVGIGISAPSKQLEVLSNIRIHDGTGLNPALEFTRNTTQGAVIGASFYADWRIDTSNANMNFRQSNANSYSTGYTIPIMTLGLSGGLTILNGFRPTYAAVTGSNLTSATTPAITSNSYGTHYNITNSAFNAITIPILANSYGVVESNAYFVFRNNTGSYLVVGISYSSLSGPASVTIPPSNSVTLMAGAGTAWVLF